MSRGQNQATIHIAMIFGVAALTAVSALPAAASSDWDACRGSEPEFSLDQQLAGCNAVIAQDPNNSDALNYRCFTRANIGTSLDTALADCNKALKLKPDDFETLDSRGFVHFRLGMWDNAIADTTAALKLNPKKASSLYIRGLAKRRKGDIAGGDADIAGAKKIEPKVAERYARWGVAP